MAKSNQKKGRFRVLFIIELLLLAVILTVGIYLYRSMHKIQRDTSQDKNIQKSENATVDGYRNIVLFGGDSRDNRLDKATHSDTIIIASLNKKTKKVKLASVYRDTYVKVPDKNEFDKINVAYYRGGYSLALSTINKNFDLDITEYVTVSFQAVVNAVDLLGGIEIDVQPEEVKWLNGYVHELNKINGTNVSDISSSGPQLLNGTRATAYARIRYTAGGDFKRTERQRLVVSKIFDKLKRSNIKTVNSFINNVFPEIKTNLSDTEMLSLAKSAMSYSIADQTGFPFEKDAHMYHGVSYVFPVDLAANVTKLHQFLFNDTVYKPSSTVQNYSDEIKSLK